MTYPLRNKVPARTYTGKKYSDYRQYKSSLRADFNKHCGYCDTRDFYCGGTQGFQIDHFRPRKKFPLLETEYENLVYSCPYCNRGKSDFFDENVFVDPCKEDYDSNFRRDNNGKIKAKSDRGKIMFSILKLGLKRHEILWIIEKINYQQKELEKKIEATSKQSEELVLLKRYFELGKKLKLFTEAFEDEI